MAVPIISGSGNNVLQTIDSASNAARVTLYSSDGHEGGSAHPKAIASNDATALNEFVLPSFNAEDYKFLSIQLTGTWVATVTFEGSNNNATYYPIATTDPSANATGQATATTKRIVKVPVITKYIQARVSAYTSGTISATIFGHYEENSSGLISTLGNITLNAETTKKIGNVGLEAGSNVIGHVIVDPSPTTMETDLYVGLASSANFNGRSIKSTATTLRSFVFTNLAATPRYLKLYDTSGVPTAGSGAPVIIVSLPAVGTLAFPLPVEGFVFSNGIGMTMTLKPENSDTTNTATVDFSIVSVFHA